MEPLRMATSRSRTSNGQSSAPGYPWRRHGKHLVTELPSALSADRTVLVTGEFGWALLEERQHRLGEVVGAEHPGIPRGHVLEPSATVRPSPACSTAFVPSTASGEFAAISRARARAAATTRRHRARRR